MGHAQAGGPMARIPLQNPETMPEAFVFLAEKTGATIQSTCFG
jgi:hypothetical protein